MTYTPNGKKIKNPRAANFVRRLSCGKYIYWFHNHSGKGFEDRNPVWLCAGTEKDGHIYWGQPEIILYDDDPKVRMSYPDFIEQDGQLYITETEKETAYTHKIDKSLLAGMLSQFDCKEVKKSDLSFEKFDVPQGCNIKMPVLKGLNNGGSFAIEMLFKLTHLNSGQILFDNRRNNKKGILVSIDINNLLVISLSDGHNFFSWNCDPGVIYSDEWHHVVINVDGGPKIVTFVIDGILCDGGDYRQFGWGRFSPQLSDVNGESHSTLASHISGSVKLVRFYNSYLKTSEAVANYHATVESLLKNNQ
jgi:hypothetical protein